MTGASFQELVLLVAIGLVVLGPKRLPQVANQIGSWIGQARRMTRMMKRQLEDEINMDLDSVNLKKQLGLDATDPARSRSDANKPWYAENGEKAAGAAGAPAESTEEKPDDYSPAHAAGDVGTGVGDVADNAGGDDASKGPAGDSEPGDASATEAPDKRQESA